jgi:hypothetical protein
MTQSLQDAFDEAAKLPQGEQEAIAAFILEELKAEKRWSDLLSGSSGKLDALANEALAEHRRGETKPLEADGDLQDD